LQRLGIWSNPPPDRAKNELCEGAKMADISMWQWFLPGKTGLEMPAGTPTVSDRVCLGCKKTEGDFYADAD
jgi:hypothetical protein